MKNSKKFQEKVWPIEYDECVQLSKLSRNKQKLVTVSVHPDVVANLKFKQHPTRKVAIASVECNLSAYNDDFKLIPTNSRIVKRKYGRMTLAKVLKEMKNRNLDVVEVKGKGETVLEIQEMDAKITVKNDGTRTKITVISRNFHFNEFIKPYFFRPTIAKPAKNCSKFCAHCWSMTMESLDDDSRERLLRFLNPLFINNFFIIYLIF